MDEIRCDGHGIEQEARGEAAPRGAVLGKVESRAEQDLRLQATPAQHLRDDRRQRAAAGIAADADAGGVEPEGARPAKDMARRDERIADRRGKLVLRRQPIVDRDDAAPGLVRQRAAQGVVRLEAACDEAAAVKIDEPGAGRGEAFGHVAAQHDGVAPDERQIVDPQRCGGRLRKLHELRERAPALVDAGDGLARAERDHRQKAPRLGVHRRKVRQTDLPPQEPRS